MIHTPGQEAAVGDDSECGPQGKELAAKHQPYRDSYQNSVNEERSRSGRRSREAEISDSPADEKPLWEVGKWMFGTSVVLGLVFGLFGDQERSPVQVSLVCAIQVRNTLLHTAARCISSSLVKRSVESATSCVCHSRNSVFIA